MRQSLIIAFVLASVACSSMGTTSSSSVSSSSATVENDSLQTINHYVRVRSTAPSMNGQFAQLYLRERASGRVLARGGAGVVLFVHGAGTPAEVAFDASTGDYSWMGYLAAAGFDTFSVDMTGYGRSSRPSAMNDPCNLARNQQTLFVPTLIAAPCAPTFPSAATTIASDWNDIDAAVEYIRSLRRADRVSMVAWSLGGPRAGGYAAQHPEKVQKLVLLAPAYGRAASDNPPAQPPAGAAMNTQSRPEFVANWDRQVGCPDQYDAGVSEAVWSQMVESDPVGATWGTGVRRAPQTTNWGWNAAMVAKTQTPTLMVAGVHDKQVAQARVRELYADLAAREKIFVDLGCSSHNAMWEKNHTILFKASLEWLAQGTVNGAKDGMLRLGYEVN
ncbi:MAG: alpha/beta fold hydrolase [Acidobacteriota bacterium]